LSEETSSIVVKKLNKLTQMNTSLDHSKIFTSFHHPSEKFLFTNFLFLFLWGWGGDRLGTSESKLISSNGVIESKIVKADKALRVVGLYQNLDSPNQALILIRLKPHPQGFTVHFVVQYSTNLLR
jgi:hypothetical protein